MKDKNFKYYVAYGSNLNIQKMHQRCPEELVYATAILSGYKLVSNKVGNNAYLSIKKEKDSYVPVVVWKINKTQEKALDEYENFPNLYHKKDLKLKVLLLNNNKHKNQMFYIYYE